MLFKNFFMLHVDLTSTCVQIEKLDTIWAFAYTCIHKAVRFLLLSNVKKMKEIQA